MLFLWQLGYRFDADLTIDEAQDGSALDPHSASGLSELIYRRMESRPTLFGLPTEGWKRDVVRRWIREELVVESQQSNVSDASPVSVVPLHIAVADYVKPSRNPPDYGRLLCELLARAPAGISLDLLHSLADFFSATGGDPVARVVAGTLGRDLAGVPDPQRRFVDLFESGQSESRLVWCDGHAARFQSQMASLLAYSGSVGRRTYLRWLYSVISFFVATYFLRMAKAADSYVAALTVAFSDGVFEWNPDLDSREYRPSIAYGHDDATHTPVLKRYPGNTSQIILARALVNKVTAVDVDSHDPAALGRRIVDLRETDDLSAVLLALAQRYPTKESVKESGESGGGKWKLSSEEKEQFLSLAEAGSTHPFVLVGQWLNFEDMAHSSNNVKEWQFYNALATHPEYGFATRRGKRRDAFRYEMTDSLLVALAHCHGHQLAAEPTLSSFIGYLEELGFDFDARGRHVLEVQLLGLGMVQSLSDSGEAKYLELLYRPEGGPL